MEAQIDGMKIYYQIHGQGASPLLLIHGAVGSCNDFRPQLDSAELGARQFTIVALDLPGQGRSGELPAGSDIECRPTLAYFELCADVCAKLMARLRFKTYSVGGWSDGARVAALLAVQCQSRVNALLLWGFTPVADKASSLAVARARDISVWDAGALSNYTQVYGETRFSELWRHYVDFVVASLELPDRQFDIRDRLSAIKCPALVVHGSDDPIVDYATHVEPIQMQIYDSQIVQFKGAAHNLHQAKAADFNRLLAQFVTSVGA